MRAAAGALARLAACAAWLGSATAAAADPPPDALRLVRQYGMQPIPVEGGWFRQSWRSGDILTGSALPARYGGRPHPAGTAILGIETADGVSTLHRLPTDEVWQFHDGDPIRMLLLHPDGRIEHAVLDRDHPLLVAPAGVWQGSRPAGPRGWSLFATTMAPGFVPADFEPGSRAGLLAGYPGAAGEIALLTHPAR